MRFRDVLGMNTCSNCEHYNHISAIGASDISGYGTDAIDTCHHPSVGKTNHITGGMRFPDPRDVRGDSPNCGKWEKHISVADRIKAWALACGIFDRRGA